MQGPSKLGAAGPHSVPLWAQAPCFPAFAALPPLCIAFPRLLSSSSLPQGHSYTGQPCLHPEPAVDAGLRASPRG